MASNRDSHLFGTNDPASSAGKKSPLDLLSADSLLNGSYRQAIENLLGSPLPADESPDLAGALPGKTNAPGTGGIEKPIPMPPPLPGIKTPPIVAPPSVEAPIGGKIGKTISGEDGTGNLGDYVNILGDINGDGYDDYVVTARPNPEQILFNVIYACDCLAFPYTNGPRAYVLYGSAGGAPSLDLDTLKPSQGFAIDMEDVAPWYYGWNIFDGIIKEISSAGDVNHDGIGDFTITFTAYTAYDFFVCDISPLVSSDTLDAETNLETETIMPIYPIGWPIWSWPVTVSYTIYGKAGTRADIDLSQMTPDSYQAHYFWDDSIISMFTINPIAIGDINGDGRDDTFWQEPPPMSVYDAVSSEKPLHIDYDSSRGVDIDNGETHLASGFTITGKDTISQWWTAKNGGDINGDGINDLLLINQSLDGGIVYVIYGRAGATATDINLDILTPGQGFKLSGKEDYSGFGGSVASGGDINGDGYDDLVIGAPSVGQVFITLDDGFYYRPAGESYVIYGGDFTHSVTLAGGTGNDLLVGKAGADIVVAGLGDDLVIGKGGVDFIRTGAGNDTIRIGDGSFGRIDGGGGSDRLVFDYEGAIAIDPERIIDIERFDMANGLANAMSLKAADVLALDLRVRDLGGKAALDNVLAIDGDFGDTLNLDAADGWQVWAGQSLAGYALYVSGFARIAVDTDIAVSIG